MKAGPLKLETPSPEGLVSMTMTSVESRDIDLDAFIHVYSPDAYVNGVGDKVWHQALGFAAYRDIAMEVPGAKITLGEVALEDMKMRQPEESFGEMFDVMIAHPDTPKDKLDEMAVKRLPGILSAFGIGRFGFENLDGRGDRRRPAQPRRLPPLRLLERRPRRVLDRRSRWRRRGSRLPEARPLRLRRHRVSERRRGQGRDPRRGSRQRRYRREEPDPEARLLRGRRPRRGDARRSAHARSTSSGVDLGGYIGPVPTSISGAMTGLRFSGRGDRRTREPRDA